MTYTSRFGNLIVEDEPVYKSELDSGLGYTAGFFSQIADGTTITNTTTETSIIGSGVGTLSVPANTFKAGNSYRVISDGFISCQNSDLIRVRLKSGAIILADTGSLSLKQATNQTFNIDVHFVVRNIGASGVAVLKTKYILAYKEDSSDKRDILTIDTINNTTFDTTINNTLDITIQWGQTKLADSLYTTTFNLNKIF